MSPSHRNAHCHFAGRAAKPSETPQGIAPRLISRKHRARLTSQTKKHHVYLWGTLAAKTCYEGESLQNSAIASKPIIFPGQKKKKKKVWFWLLWVFFLVTNSLQTLARSPWFCCLPEGRAGSVGNISSSPDAQGVSSQWPLCHLLGAGGAAVVTMVPSFSDLQCAWIQDAGWAVTLKSPLTKHGLRCNVNISMYSEYPKW